MEGMRSTRELTEIWRFLLNMGRLRIKWLPGASNIFGVTLKHNNYNN